MRHALHVCVGCCLRLRPHSPFAILFLFHPLASLTTEGVGHSPRLAGRGMRAAERRELPAAERRDDAARGEQTRMGALGGLPISLRAPSVGFM